MIALTMLSFISIAVLFLGTGVIAKDDAIEATKTKLPVHRAFLGHSSEPPKKLFERHPRDDIAPQMGLDPSMTIVETMLPPLKDKEGNVLIISDLCPVGMHGKLYAMAGAGGVFEISLEDWSVKTFEEPQQGVLATDGKCISVSILGPFVAYAQYDISSDKTTFRGCDVSTGNLMGNIGSFSGRVQSVAFGEDGVVFAMQDGSVKVSEFPDAKDSPDLEAAIQPGAKIAVFPFVSSSVYIGNHENSDKSVTSFIAFLTKDTPIQREFGRKVEDATMGDYSMTAVEGGLIFSDGFDVQQINDDEEINYPLAGDRYQSGSRDGLAPEARFGKLSAIGYSTTLRTLFVADSNGIRRITPGKPFNIANAAFLDFLTPIQATGYGLTGNKKYAYDLQFGPGTSITQTSQNSKGSTSLGALQASNYLGDGKFSFDNGDKCKGGINRRGTLQLLCAGSLAVFVTETERCVYEVLYMSPDFCD